MILDANLLLYAVDESSPHHERASTWLSETLNGQQRVGLPWQTLGAFLRIATHPRVSRHPLTAEHAQQFVDRWLAATPTWVPPATETTTAIYAGLATRHHITGNLVPDAQLAALALEFGVPVMSADSDFARFTEVRWINPLA
jgi:toxin-antitoxin system PIN domain toxin